MMKKAYINLWKLLLVIIVNLAILLIPCRAGIFMEIWESLDDQTPVITYHYCNGNHWKIEDTEGVSTIIDFKNNQFIVIYPKEKIYAITNLSDVIDEMKKASEKIIAENNSSKEKEGIFERKFISKEIVNNIECNHYIIYESKEILEELWFTNDINLKPLEDIFKKLKNISKPSQKLLNYLIDEEKIEKLTSGLGFPIKIKTYTASGIVLSEVKYYQKKEFDEEEFSVPMGYEKVPLIEIYIRAYGNK